MDQNALLGSERDSKANHQKTCFPKAGRKQKPVEGPKNLGETLSKTVRHFFRPLGNWIKAIKDPRDPDQVIYSKSHLFWCGILLFILHSQSRRQFFRERLSDYFLKNLLCLSESSEEHVAHPDTLSYFLKRLPPESLEGILSKMVSHLIRNKVLDAFRLQGHFLIAVDGTGQFSFHERHCEHCLTRKSSSGETLYYHSVLEAKLVTGNGMALSVATEFIENVSPDQSKQDCELKAFSRLAPKLKQAFPRTPLCLLMDALYAGKPTFDLCVKMNWKYFITFKEGSMPATYQESQEIMAMTPDLQKRHGEIHKTQIFRWVESLPYGAHNLKAIFCEEKTDTEKMSRFAWITNFEVNEKNVVSLANQGGRFRWKIENEGFNAQKNGGFALEHAYSLDPMAAKNFYFLLQIAHLLVQLLVKGSLFENFKTQMGSLRNFARRIAESLRNVLIDPEVFKESRFQIRLNTA